MFHFHRRLGPEAQYSLDLHDIEAAHTLQALGQMQVSGTELNTREVMTELSYKHAYESEVHFRRARGCRCGPIHLTESRTK